MRAIGEAPIEAREGACAPRINARSSPVCRMLNELRFAFRTLTKSPAFSIIAIATLALAIGATTAVLSLVNALLVRPLPYRAPQELVLLFQHFKAQNLERIPVSPPEFVDYQTHMRSFQNIGAFNYATFNLSGGDNPERIPGAVVTAGVFQTLGIEPIKGRAFRPEECQTGRDDVVIISARLWKRRFNSDPQIIGSKLLLDGRSFTVVGIMPEKFDFPLQLFNLGGGQFAERAEIWQPLAFTDAQMKNRYSRSLGIIARLASGVSVSKAQAEIEMLNRQMRREHRDAYSQDESFGGDLFALKELAVGGMRPTLLILLGAVFLVLMIACANLSTMLLARAAAHDRETAIRVALGASRLRLLRQMLIESLLLAVCGGLAGIFLAVWGVDLLKSIGAQTVPRLREVDLDLTVLFATLVISVGTGIVFGIIPGLAGAKPELTEALKEGGRGSTEGRRRNRLRNILVIAEVALALVLLTSAGLLMKSFVRLQNVSPGFSPQNVMTMELSFPKLKYNSNEAVVRFTDEAERRVAALPGVEAAAFTAILPLSGTNSDSSFSIEGRPTSGNDPFPDEEYREVSSDYFRVLQTPLQKGRFFNKADNATSPHVMIVNQALAQKYWPKGALGKRITFGDPKKKDAVWVTIVGIVGNIKHRSLDEDAKPEMYVPWEQDPYSTGILVVRSAQDPRNLISAIRREVQAIDPTQPVAHIRALEDVIADSVAPRRLSVVLLGVFAGAAILLASVGIYGVMSFLVVQRTHEIGVRMALGAQRADVLRLVLFRALKLVVLGVTIGLTLALCSTRVLSALLYRVSAFDAPTFALVALILAVVALFASYIPARRATRADPMIALGHG